jgi:hypothetical protein
MVVFIQATSVNYDPHADFECKWTHFDRNFLLNLMRAVICTSGLYWSMIEAGLGVCAACLPAQYGLFNTKGVQSIVNSVQSAISLRSIRSQTQRGSPSASGYVQSKDWASASDTKNITAHAEGPAHGDIRLEAGMGNGIMVTNSFESRQEFNDEQH